MKKYQLKDPKKAALLKAFCEAFNISGDEAERNIADYMTKESVDSVFFYGIDDSGSMFLAFPKYYFVEKKPYNPNGWNPFPGTTPPVGVLMRVEFTEGEGEGEQRHYIAAKWDGEKWLHYDDFTANVSIKNFRFRPWE